jgi:adiponectin receptor
MASSLAPKSWLTSVEILTLGSATIFITVNPQFQGRRWRTFRACTFVGTALSGFVPIIHGVIIFGWSQMVKQSGVLYYLLEGLFLMIGALCYTVSTVLSLRSKY